MGTCQKSPWIGIRRVTGFSSAVSSESSVETHAGILPLRMSAWMGFALRMCGAPMCLPAPSRVVPVVWRVGRVSSSSPCVFERAQQGAAAVRGQTSCLRASASGRRNL